MADATGRGDVDRTLRLLWRERLAANDDAPGRRGPKQRTSVDEVVAAAITLADEEGIEAVSMRRVADRLGLRPMSVYTYVPGKAELVDLMVDQVAAEQPMPPHPDDLRARLEAVARTQWAEYRAHPWLLRVDVSRPVLGPHVSDRWEWALRAVEGVGLDDIEMDRTIALVLGYVAGPARALDEAERARSDSGESDLQWWERNAPVLEAVMDESRYPVSGRVGTTTGEAYQSAADPAGAFEFGLARVLDGVVAYVQARQG